MADVTGIQWCDATFNPWVGCEKVSPGCAHCYAETLVTGRMARPGTWGKDGVRERTSESNWKKPLRWAKLARDGRLPNGEPNPDGHRPRVFCASLADVFEDRPELEPWRRELFHLIEQTLELDWLLLTKRPEYARDWLGYWYSLGGPTGIGRLPNVWLGVSIENARHTWRADVLRQIPAAVRFISAEPLLGSLFQVPGRDPEEVLPSDSRAESQAGSNGPSGSPTSRPGRAPLDLSGIDWVICGGESGPGARPFHLEHVREVVRACRQQPTVFDFTASSVTPRPAVFVKQLGAHPIHFDARNEVIPGDPLSALLAPPVPLDLRDRKGGDWNEWPADLRIREFPRGGHA